MQNVPSSHGSLDVDPEREPREEDARLSPHEDGFDSEEFREWLAQRRARGNPRRDRRSRRAELEDGSEDERSVAGNGRGSGGGGPPPPEWDGTTTSFQDWLIKAKLWLATTRAKPRTQGPMILQRLSGQAFQSLKHYARDASWLNDDRNGHKLLEVMDTPELFGEDREEELLAALSKLTYHLRRQKEEGCRVFFNKFDDAVRKIQEHKVNLPEKYLGFLLINALNISEIDIKAMLAFTQGSILVRDVKSWCRKHEMKLLAKDVGSDRKNPANSRPSAVMNLQPDEEDLEDDEILAMEELWRELQPVEGDTASVEDSTLDDEELMDEHEAKEVLSTMLNQRKKTFMQSLRTKKAKNLARGYGQWRNGGSSSQRSQSSMSTSGYMKGGFYRMSLSEAKSKSRCSKCQQVGHWHREPECPLNKPGANQASKPKEIHLVESEEAIFCGLLDRADETDPEVTNESPAISLSGHFGLAETVQDSVNTDHGYGQSNFEAAYKGCRADGCVDSVGIGGSGRLDVAVGGNEHEVHWFTNKISNHKGNPDIPKDELCATVDTGCQRMAIGMDTLQKMNAALPSGLQSHLVPQEHRFRSVHGTSSTKYVAVIPTSLGNRGSLLRPAVFEHGESRTAPFLISLPFLIHCQAVLHLDPSRGLRIHFRKFGFTVKCHIGPTGALRVPLSQFTPETMSYVQQAQEQMSASGQEFEVLKTTSECTAAEGSIVNDRNCSKSLLSPETCHGESRPDQEGPSEHQRGPRANVSLEANGDEVDHGPTSCDVPDHRPDDAEKEEGSILSLAAVQYSRGDLLRCRECRELPGHWGVRGKHVTGDQPAADTELTGTQPVLGRGELHHRGSHDSDGTTTDVPSPNSEQVVCDSQTGAQLGPNVLEVPQGKARTMPILRMDDVPTTLDGGARTDRSRRTLAGTAFSEEHVGTNNTREYVNGKFHVEGTNLSTPEDTQIWLERSTEPSDVLRLRNDSLSLLIK